MARELISKRTRITFREHLVSWTLGEIDDAFDGQDISRSTDYDPPLSGQRRSRVEQYYHSLDFRKPADVRKVLKVYEEILDELATSQRWEPADRQALLARLVKTLHSDGYHYQNGRLVTVASNPGIAELHSIATAMDIPHLHQQIERMVQAVDSDPRLAIGTAKELIETTCKTILTDRGKTLEGTWDVMELVKATRKELQLSPDDIPDQAKAADTIKRLLNNLATVVQGLAELRQPYGTGHGQQGRARGLRPRHARLAVGAAVTLSTFLLETHQARGEQDTQA